MSKITDKVIAKLLDKIAGDLELEVTGQIDLKLKKKNSAKVINEYTIPVSAKLNLKKKKEG